jgi:CheY-like chemotaxis protein
MPGNVLIVDDNETTTEITARMLAGRGYDVMTALDGTRALAMVAERRPDVVLLDIMMPAMSGLEVLAALREGPATRDIPVILLTAKSQDEDVLAGYKAGADYYITKPFTAQELIYGIKLVLGDGSSVASGPT